MIILTPQEGHSVGAWACPRGRGQAHAPTGRCRQSPIRINLSGVPRGSSPLAGFKECPLENLFSFLAPPSAAREKKKVFWGHPKPRQGEPCTPWATAMPVS